jgi:N-formylglutamate amidohydrolase
MKQPGLIHRRAVLFPWRILSLLATLIVTVAAQAADASELVLARRGNLPILLTAPHGGAYAIPWVSARTGNLAVVTMDAHTLELTEALASKLKALLGNEPYLVAARFHRRYLDANRKAADAFENAKAEPHHAYYHSRIRDFVTEIRQKFPQGALLLDIHGQATDPNTLYRGTANGWTVERLLAKHGPAALIGDKSLFGVIGAKGWGVFPPNTSMGNPPEERRYSGGYTVRTYGSNNADGIDAIQLEFGANLRREPRVVDDVAEAIAVYYKTYLTTPAQKP